MLQANEKVLGAMVHLEGDPSWEVVKDWFRSEAKDEMNDALHILPDASDVNFETRNRINQGIAICVDILSKTCDNCISLLSEEKEYSNEIRDMLGTI